MRHRQILVHLWILGIALLVFGYPGELALAQSACGRDNLAKWYNPKPDPNSDFMLPMPGGMFLTFVPVPLTGSGLFLDEKSVFRMGSSEPQSHVFETPLDVRVGSSIADLQGHAELLIDKYELSKGQYVMIMGNGDIAKGVQALVTNSHDPAITETLQAYAIHAIWF